MREYESGGAAAVLNGEIRQVFSNLIANAIDAMSEGGTLRVRITNSREWNNSGLPGVRITVADDGSGIPREQRKYLFEPFHTTKKTLAPGWDCGLLGTL